MDFTEKTLRKAYKFRGKIMSARVDDIELPNGRPAIREVCEHVGGVGVLPIDENGNVILVRQYRYPYGEVICEIPAGKTEHGRRMLNCAAGGNCRRKPVIQQRAWCRLASFIRLPDF